jgi:hypothetical protein
LIKRYGTEEPSTDGSLNVAAYFFCKHDDTMRNDPRRAVATLVYRLAARFPAMAQELQVSCLACCE